MLTVPASDTFRHRGVRAAAGVGDLAERSSFQSACRRRSPRAARTGTRLAHQIHLVRRCWIPLPTDQSFATKVTGTMPFRPTEHHHRRFNAHVVNLKTIKQSRIRSGSHRRPRQSSVELRCTGSGVDISSQERTTVSRHRIATLNSKWYRPIPSIGFCLPVFKSSRRRGRPARAKLARRRRPGGARRGRRSRWPPRS